MKELDENKYKIVSTCLDIMRKARQASGPYVDEEGDNDKAALISSVGEELEVESVGEEGEVDKVAHGETQSRVRGEQGGRPKQTQLSVKQLQLDGPGQWVTSVRSIGDLGLVNW